MRACLGGFPLFASGLGMKGPGGLVREERADVSWPVGTWFSRIRLPSRAGSGSTLTRSLSRSCLSPVPLLPPTPLPSAAPLSLSASAYFFSSFFLRGFVVFGNAFRPIQRLFFFENYPLNRCRRSARLNPNSHT